MAIGWALSGLWAVAGESAALIVHDPAQKIVTIGDASRELVLRLRYDGRCLLDQMIVGGRNVVSTNTGICSAMKAGGEWFTTRQGIPIPTVRTSSNTVVITDITCGGSGIQFKETWRFTALADRLLWRLEREYLTSGTVEDICFPGWDFMEMSTWTGALLGHGGVAWCKLFDAPHATYGVHAGEMTFWNRQERTCLRISPDVPPEKHGKRFVCRRHSARNSSGDYCKRRTR